eukprot:CAMPEP_0116562338 /NCGR_PEP_ID=MMETSP0397-20121206/12100_1 /TAXON_ID=216820 /ORGANISM="Cyclophora tenuis, Strain ECT3854" /LENGTH=255 /DNA_ID=CAMNT_0004088615 /DNA_START=144 /DNA_END=911 /DNA_ORIENTATION=-
MNLLDLCLLNAPSFEYQSFSHVDINSHNPPTILDNTICIHPLSSTAFSPLAFKVANAKYLGFDHTPLPSRILKDYAGDLTVNECWYATFYREGVFQNQGSRERFQYHLASLVALAVATQRTLVLPRYFRDKDGYALSVPSIVDIRSIEKLVPYRFMLHNEARLWADDQQVVKVEMGHNSIESFRMTQEALVQRKKIKEARVVAIKQSCALIPETPKSPTERQVIEIISQLDWCLEKDTDLTFKRAIGGYDRFCGV